MVSVKGIPKVSAKEKFAAAQAAKAAKKAEDEKAAADKEAARTMKKAYHDAAFEAEKRKVSKKVQAEALFMEHRRAEFLAMTKEQRTTKLAELTAALRAVERQQKTDGLLLNDGYSMVGKEASNYAQLNMMIGLLRVMM